jgi:hypothetical protein
MAGAHTGNSPLSRAPLDRAELDPRRGRASTSTSIRRFSMRALATLFAALALSACASVTLGRPAVVKGSVPLEILRDPGQPPRMGQARVEVGGYQPGDPFMFDIYFDSDGTTLGKPKSVSWQMKFGDYCRDRPSYLQSILIGPSGQVWRVRRVFVPAGPDRGQDWSSGGFSEDDGPEAQALLDAAAAGGRFILALEDDAGVRWNTAVIDTLTPKERQRQFAANLAEFAKVGPDAAPVASDLLTVVHREVQLPSTVRPCPIR